MALIPSFVRPSLILVLLFSTNSLFPCDCGVPGPACAYITQAKVAFVGTPVYSNDDHSGTFRQRTLYRFEVEEIFKGLPEGTKVVWVDPGSFTSCYAVYKLGTKLLVFANGGGTLPSDSAAVTVATPSKKTKTLPPGFDPKTPVYYAPECNGTRPADVAGGEIAWLRSWKQGKTQAQFHGEVHDSFGQPLQNVAVSAINSHGEVTTTTDSDGKWTFNQLDPGTYNVRAQLPKYLLLFNPSRDVPENGCAYVSLPMQGTGVVAGTVIGPDNKPVADVEVRIGRLLQGNDLSFAGPPSLSSADGAFSFSDLPAGDYIVGVNMHGSPDVRVPYETTYLPGIRDREAAQVLHIEPGQRLAGLRLLLGRPLRLRMIHARVIWPDGRSVGKGVSVSADFDNDRSFETSGTNSSGIATLKCLSTLPYEVTAHKWLSKLGEFPARCVRSKARRVPAGTDVVTVTLVLSHKVRTHSATERDKN